uniref:HTH_11 domain-containing protein n=1 Tax=Strongyloides papillosus TaxID=174720 RepID=A0A0N5BLM3_STREA
MLSKRDIRAFMLYEFKREGSEDLENEERERPETVIDNDELREAVEANPRATVRSLAEDLNVSTETIFRHLKEIEKTKKLDKWVPHELNDYQKMCRFEFCFSLILRNKNDPFLSRLITCDEKWILYDNRKRTGQWLDKNEAPKHFSKPKLTPKKVMTLQKLNELGYETLPHPAYSPDLAPTDFHFFKHFDNFLTEKIFRNDEDIKTAFEAFIESRTPDFYANGINKLVSR